METLIYNGERALEAGRTYVYGDFTFYVYGRTEHGKYEYRLVNSVTGNNHPTKLRTIRKNSLFAAIIQN